MGQHARFGRRYPGGMVRVKRASVAALSGEGVLHVQAAYLDGTMPQGTFTSPSGMSVLSRHKNRYGSLAIWRQRSSGRRKT